MHQEFNAEQRPVIYDPIEFEQFCRRNGAPTLFTNLCQSMTDARHSEERREQNKYVAMTVIYELCYGRSQNSNYLQMDHDIYLKLSHTTQEGIDTEKRIGNTVCSRTVENEFRKLADRNAASVNRAISMATENGWLAICVIDDYTTIHANRRPTLTSKQHVHYHLQNIFRDKRSTPNIVAVPSESFWC